MNGMMRLLAPCLLSALILGGCHRQSVTPPPQAVAAPSEQPPPGKKVEEPKPDDSSLSLASIQDLLVKENKVFRETHGYAEYRLAPGDVVHVTLWEKTEPKEHDLLVKPDGTVSFSFIEDLPATGLTPAELETAMTDALKKYIRRPRVDVSMKEYHGHVVTLFGQIKSLSRQPTGPGRYFLTGKTTVIDLIAFAGGETKEANLRKVTLTRADGKSYFLDLSRGSQKSALAGSVPLDHGDLVYIPSLSQKPQQVFVFGEVLKPGMYPYHEEMTPLEAVALAGGYTKVAVLESARIVRKKPEGVELLETNLDEILSGREPPRVALANGDIVYIPRSLVGDWNVFIEKLMPTVSLASQISGITGTGVTTVSTSTP